MSFKKRVTKSISISWSYNSNTDAKYGISYGK